MIPVNYDAKMDPHFGEGKIAPIHASIFVVYVKRGERKPRKKEKYIVALPPQCSWGDTMKLLKKIISRVIDDCDIYSFDDLDWDSFSNSLDMPKTPILSYDPRDEDEFFWIFPPKELRH